MDIYYTPVGKQTPAIASAFKVHLEASATAYSLAERTVVQRYFTIDYCEDVHHTA